MTSIAATATASRQLTSPIAIRTATAAAIATAIIRGDHLGANSRAAPRSVLTSRPKRATNESCPAGFEQAPQESLRLGLARCLEHLLGRSNLHQAPIVQK